MASLDTKTVLQKMAIGLLLAAGLFSSILILNDSWIRLLTLSLTLGCGIIWFVSHGKLAKISKYIGFSLMIFSICFALFECHIFSNAGYPPTYDASIPDVSVSYPSILNVSLTELVQGVEETVAFNLFSLEHFGETTLYSILLNTNFPPRGVEVSFYTEDSGTSLIFQSSGGYPYHASIWQWHEQWSYWQLSQQQTPQEALKQMDDLGLQWFYDRVCELYQNSTGTNPDTDGLDVMIQWRESNGEYNGDEYTGYRDLYIGMSGWQHTDTGNHDIFHASFQPDGTLIYFTCKTV